MLGFGAIARFVLGQTDTGAETSDQAQGVAAGSATASGVGAFLFFTGSASDVIIVPAQNRVIAVDFQNRRMIVPDDYTGADGEPLESAA